MVYIFKNLQFSDGMKEVIIYLQQTGKDVECHYSMPFKVGETMINGNFTSKFIECAARRAVQLFYPREFYELRPIFEAVAAIRRAASDIEKEPDIIDIINKLVYDLGESPSEEPTGTEGDAFQLYKSVKLNLYMFGRDGADKTGPRKKNGVKIEDEPGDFEGENDENL